MARKDEILAQEQLEEIQKANRMQLEQIVIKSMHEARKIIRLMKDDQQIQALIVDKKHLEGAYKDKIDGSKMRADLALDRLEAMDEL